MGVPANMTPGHCLDCKAPVVSGTMDGEYTIVHSGLGCEGFRRRFSAPGTTRAMNESGEAVPTTKPELPAHSGKKGDK